MGYQLSESVKVFPSSYRSLNNNGKFTSELNITNAIKAVCENDSFVVGYDDTTKTLKLVVDGYYFEISGYNIPASGKVTAYIYTSAGYLFSCTDGNTVLDNSDNFFVGLYLQSGTEQLPARSTSQLVVSNNGKLINKGYIPELCDKDGNWIDLSSLVNDDGLIDPSKIDWSSLGTKGSRGTVTGNNIISQAIWLQNGQFKENIKITVSKNNPSGTGTRGDMWFVIEE